MTQYSYPWQGLTPGDSIDGGPYTADAWWQRVVAMLQTGGMVYPSAGSPIKTETSRDNLGVCPNIANELAVTNPAGSNIQIDTGAAIAEGQPYYNTVAITLAVPAPTVNPRIDRIVIRKNYTAVEYDPTGDAGVEEVPAYSARITRIVGTEAAVPVVPDLTQSTGRTIYWDVPLAQFQISIAGAVSGLTDEREYGPQWGIKNIVNKTRSFFVPPVGNTSAAAPTEVGFEIGAAVFGFGFFVVPADFVSDMVVKSVFVPVDAPSGTDYADIRTIAYYGGDGEGYDEHTPSNITEYEIEAADEDTRMFAPDIDDLSLPDAAVDDVVSLSAYFIARGDGSDYAGEKRINGWLVEYTADS